MKIKDTQLVSPITGEDLKNGEDILKLFSTISNILLTTKTADPAKSYTIAFKIIKEKECDLTSEEITHIKETVKASEAWLPIVTGQVIELLK